MLRKLIVDLVAILPKNIVWIFSKKYIAGKLLDEAVQVSKKLNEKNADVTIDLLGEFQDDLEAIEKNYDQYVEIILKASQNQLNTTFSVKPTMFGLLSHPDICHEKIEQLIKMAASNGRLVRLDMEDSSCTDKEIELFLKLYKKYPASVGLVLQAYLRRTLDDVKYLAGFNNTEHPVNIRLCKGIYNEPKEMAFKKHDSINNNYLSCLKLMLENNFYCAIATHDNFLVEQAKIYLMAHNKAHSAYEFQMLYGVKPRLRERLIKEGHRMRVYVPFGESWYAYSIRRLKENPQIAMHIIKSLFMINS